MCVLGGLGMCVGMRVCVCVLENRTDSRNVKEIMQLLRPSLSLSLSLTPSRLSSSSPAAASSSWRRQRPAH